MEVNGEIFQKPFVEKPVCAEDHNVYIYYPTSAGGGSQRLFRKVRSPLSDSEPGAACGQSCHILISYGLIIHFSIKSCTSRGWKL